MAEPATPAVYEERADVDTRDASAPGVYRPTGEAPDKIDTLGVFDERRSGGSLLDFAGGLGYHLPARGEILDERERSLSDDRTKAVTERGKAYDALTSSAHTERATIDRESAEGAAARAAARPGELKLPDAPSGKARTPFDPGPDASMLTQLQTAALALGSLAQQVGGIRGSAIAAVSAAKGMYEGWAAGDNDRVEREFKAWKASSAKLTREHEAALGKYQSLVEDQKLTWDQKRVAGTLALKGLEWTAAQKALDVGDIDAALKEVTAARQRHDAMIEKTREFDLAHQEKIDARQERAREADAKIAETIANREQRASDSEAMRDLRRDLAAMATDNRRAQVDLQQMRGGPWVVQKEAGGLKRGQIVDNITRGEWDQAGGQSNFKVLGGGKNTVMAIDIVESEGLPAVDQLKLIGERILAKYPGQNLAKLVANWTAGKLSDPDIKEYDQARRMLTFSLGRSMTGSPTLRKFALQALEEAEVATKGDTRQTMHRMAENSRTAMINFIRGQKGMKAFAFPASARTVEAVNAQGELAEIKLAPYEPLPEGWSYVY